MPSSMTIGSMSPFALMSATSASNSSPSISGKMSASGGNLRSPLPGTAFFVIDAIGHIFLPGERAPSAPGHFHVGIGGHAASGSCWKDRRKRHKAGWRSRGRFRLRRNAEGAFAQAVFRFGQALAPPRNACGRDQRFEAVLDRRVLAVGEPLIDCGERTTLKLGDLPRCE